MDYTNNEEKQNCEGGIIMVDHAPKVEVNVKVKKLLVLDLNGLLLHRAHRANKSEIIPNRTPDAVCRTHFIYKRPYLEEFIKFCLEKFEVGIWSSAQEKNVEGALDCALKELRNRFLFIWTLEKKNKPLFFKELKQLWESVGGGQFSESNTLLIDNEPYKALLNPPNTGIFPGAYDAGDLNDNALDPKMELGMYLEDLSLAEDVPSYVKEHPFGQPAIGPSHPHWEFYSRVLSHSKNNRELLV